jgi:hypothetical protein
MTQSTTNRLQQAIDLISTTKDGFISWTDDKETRTMIHGFLFHYELTIVKGLFLISGKSPCTHQGNCAYMVTYSIINELFHPVSNEELPGERFNPKRITKGCCFLHAQDNDNNSNSLTSDLNNIDIELFKERLAFVYSIQQERNVRECRQMVVSSKHYADGNQKQILLPIFNDGIFDRTHLFPTLMSQYDF